MLLVVDGRLRLRAMPGSLQLTILVAGLAISLPASAIAATGGALIVPTPKIKNISCKKGCAKQRAIQDGSTIVIRGSGLSTVQTVRFLGGPGTSDDIAAPAEKATAKTVIASVPANANSGPVVVETVDSLSSQATVSVSIKPLPPIIATGDLKPVEGLRESNAPAIETATSVPRKVFFGARRMVAFSFRINEANSASATVQLVRLSDSAVIRSWDFSDVPTGAVQTIDWDGTAEKSIQPDGRYAFRLAARGASGAVARSAVASDNERDAFDFHGHIFPVRGTHDYGGSEARFGAGRPGHVHQGHDVFAKCGTPMVAARGGVVRFRQFHSAAGHYIVINGEGTNTDYVYMHMRSASPFKPGDRVFTGQKIGEVGDTGRASGCHLHFELWDSPGWYNGGKPFDPLTTLQAWDDYS